MAAIYRETPSRLMRIEDDYTAFCLDEAIAEVTMWLKNGRKPKPKKTQDNDDLIRRMEGR